MTGFNWRDVAYTFNGYEAVGVQQCGEIAIRVQEGIGAGGALEGFSIDELRIALFFSARAEHHVGDASLVSPVEDAIVAELLRRKGEAWLRNEISHSVSINRTPTRPYR